MNPDNKKRLMKYLFYISVLFATLISAHFVYLFLYHDSSQSAKVGGVLSEGFVGEIPSLNPLVDENDTNSYIMNLTYRSLMKYNPETEKFEDDIASCNTENLSFIKCTIKDGGNWSDSSSIHANDVYKTFKILKEKKIQGKSINPKMEGILNSVTIETYKNIVQFSSSKKDVNLLNILSQPIVKAYYIDRKSETLGERFNYQDGYYSGPYEITETSTNDNLGIKKLVLKRNPYYSGKDKIYIEKIVLNFFKTPRHLESNLDKINALYDKSGTIVKTSPRFDDKIIHQNRFTSVFLNSNKIKNEDLRALILSSINRKAIISKLGEDYKEALNPYLTDKIIDNFQVKNKSLVSIMEDDGYFKLSSLSKKLTSDSKELKVEKIFNDQNKDLTYLIKGVKKEKIFTTEGNTLITGITNGENPDAIYFNDYKLGNYKKGSNLFYYRIKTSYANLKEGYNNYTVYFEKNGQKEKKESFSIFYNPKQSIVNDELKKVKKQISESLSSNDKEVKEISSETKDKIKKLNKDYFYNTDLNKFTLNIYYYANKEEYKIIAKEIKKALSEIGIEGVLNEISIVDFTKAIVAGDKEYDILISGIDLGYLKHNIFPYFHSSQAKSGVNFSNIKVPNLDISLETLKSKNLSKGKIEDFENAILDIIKEEKVIKTIYTPPVYYLVDKKVKDTKDILNLPKMSDRYGIYDGAYIAYDRKIADKDKGLFSFIKFLFDVING